MRKSPIVAVVICLMFTPSTCFMEWLFGQRSEANNEETVTQTTSSVTFEIPTADNKFLQLKDTLDNLSPLDACYHIVKEAGRSDLFESAQTLVRNVVSKGNNIDQPEASRPSQAGLIKMCNRVRQKTRPDDPIDLTFEVVYQLKKRCGQLTEEDLGKLSVQLLNCQSSAEDRPTYSCTESMTLSECTKEMDGTVWNSYHIVSNRARSLCYATQQHQFRRLTEATVNKLMSSAHGQLEYMQQLQAGQEQLHYLTTDTVRKLYESQNDLLGNQENLRSSQNDVLAHIHKNMAELMQEKAMIASGNKELAELTENIRTKLDKTTDQLVRQETTQLESHEKILDDLTHIQRKSQDALSKLDNSSLYLMRNHKEMMAHYGLMYDNMAKINRTVAHLLTTINSMQENLDERINWFTHLISVADDKLSILTCGAVHIGFFLFAALASSFIQTPSFSRLVLFLLVAINATMEVQCGHSLDFLSISVFMVIFCSVNWLVIYWCRKRSAKPGDPLQSIGALPHILITDSGDEGETTEAAGNTRLPVPLSPSEVRQLASTLERLYTSLNESIVTEGGDNLYPSQSTPAPTPGPSGGGFLQIPNLEPSTSTGLTPGASGSAFTQVRKPEQVRPDSSTMQDGVTKVRRYLLEQVEESSSLSGYSPSEGHRSTPRRRPGRPSSRASTSTNRSLCQGFTKAGTPCRCSSSAGGDYCYRHGDQAS